MRRGAKAEPVTNWHRAGAILLGIIAGYVVGGAVMETADMVSGSLCRAWAQRGGIG